MTIPLTRAWRACLAAAILAAVSLAATGCGTARTTEVLTQRIASDDEAGGQLEFWHALPGAPVVSNDDAMHAALIYLDGRDPIQTYAHRLVELKERGLLPGSFNEPADAAVTRGTLATVLVRMLEVDGGLMMRVLGAGPRYATREMQYLNLYPLSSPQQTFSGSQVVEVFSKVEDYQRRHPALTSPHPPMPAHRPPPGLASKPYSPSDLRPYDIKALALARLVAALTASPTFFAQAQAAPPAPEAAAPADPDALTVQITAVQGLAQVRTAEDQPWQPAQVGQQLPIGAEFRTGPRSVVQFKVGPTQTVTLDRLGTVKVIDAVRRAEGGVITDVGMKYGRTSMEVQAAGIEHQSQIRSPSATLAVRGSRGILEDIGGTLRAMGEEGDVEWARQGEGRFIKLPPPSEHEDDQNSTAENRLADSGFNANLFGTTPLEQWLLSQYPNGTYEQSLLGFDVFSQQDGLVHEEVEIETITAEMVLFLNFSPAFGGVSDFDLRLLTPSGDTISPTQNDPFGLLVHSGDDTSFDVEGFGMTGQEMIDTANNMLLPGSYVATVINKGPDAGLWTLNGFYAEVGEGFNFLNQSGTLTSGQSETIPFDIPPEAE